MISYNQREINAEMDYSLKKTFDMDPRETKTKEG
jgi:hypothetical protein